MLESLAYLGGTLLTITVIVKIAPSGTSPVPLVVLAITLLAVLATAQHGPAALVAVLDAISRVVGR